MAFAPGTPTITVTLLTRRTGAAAVLSCDKVWTWDHSWTYAATELDEARTRARETDREFNAGYRIPGKEFRVTCKRTTA